MSDVVPIAVSKNGKDSKNLDKNLDMC
jgi:hypothetical protein